MNLGLAFKTVFSFLIPFVLRQDRMVEWIGALLQPLQTLNDTFVLWASGLRYFLRFNGQVLYLEHVLNDQYDASLRRIFIDDPVGNVVITTYVHNRIEFQPPLYLYNIADASEFDPVVYNTSELFVSEDDFVVHVPTAAFSPAIEVQMRDLIDKYRIAGKRYSFQTF